MIGIRTSFLLLFVVAMLSCQQETKQKAGQQVLKEDYAFFIGSYTKKEGHVDGKSKGIARLSYNKAQNKWWTTMVAQDIVNPSYLAINSGDSVVYAVSEVPNGQIVAYKVAKDNTLTKIGNKSTGGDYPCHIGYNVYGRMLIISNYGGGVQVQPLIADGNLSPNKQSITFQGKSVHARQEASHPHGSTFSKDDAYAYIADLGTDEVHRYQLLAPAQRLMEDTKKTIKLGAGGGPRQVVLHPSGRFVFTINELNCRIDVLRQNLDTKAFSFVTSHTIKDLADGMTSCADIQASPDGQYLYVSNRGNNMIYGYSIDLEGNITEIQQVDTKGKTPRNFVISQDGSMLLVANQDSDNITVFDRNSVDGLLKFNSNVAITTPVCIKEWNTTP